MFVAARHEDDDRPRAHSYDATQLLVRCSEPTRELVPLVLQLISWFGKAIRVLNARANLDKCDVARALTPLYPTGDRGVDLSPRHRNAGGEGVT